jgi:hypothetical protein
MIGGGFLAFFAVFVSGYVLLQLASGWWMLIDFVVSVNLIHEEWHLLGCYAAWLL